MLKGSGKQTFAFNILQLSKPRRALPRRPPRTRQRLVMSTPEENVKSSVTESAKSNTEWLDLAFPHNQGFKDDNDPALNEALNEVCNMTLKALLNEDEGEILDIQDELYSLGGYFSKQGNSKASLFMFVLFKMCNHEIPKAVDQLEGLYKEAFLKMGSMFEDSGWELQCEKDDPPTDESEGDDAQYLEDPVVAVFWMNIPLDATAELPEEQKRALLQSIEKAQIRDSMRMYNSLIARCFDHCIGSFRSKALDSSEERCVRNCCGKFLTYSSRIGMRFAELSAEMEKQQMEQLNKMQKEMK